MACYYIKNGSLKSPKFSEFEALIKKEKLTNEEEERLKDLRDELGILDNRDFDTLKQSIKSILRDRIIQSCRVFVERGSINLTAKENICEMYKWYTAMGGNGTCKYYFTEMDNLPVENTPTVPRVGGNAN